MDQASVQKIEPLERALDIATLALDRAKSTLMHQRRFGTDSLAGWRSASCACEGDVEEALEQVRSARTGGNVNMEGTCDASA